MGAAAFAAVAILGQAPAPRLDALRPWGPDEALLHSLVHETILEPTPTGWRSDVVEALELDGTAVRLTLRRGLRWHDGEPVAAHDVCTTLGTLGAPGANSPFAPGVRARVVDCQVQDPRTVRVNLREGADPVRALAVPLVPTHLRPEHGGDPRATVHVGCGPYAATALPGGGWSLEAMGRSPYDDLLWVPAIPGAVAADLVRRGEALAAATVPADALGTIRDAGVPLLPWDRPLSWAIAIDPQGPWADRRVRRALDVLLDRVRLAKTLAGSITPPAWPSTGPFPAGDPGVNRAIPPVTRDVEQGAAWLRQAGFRPGPDGRWTGAEPLVLRLGVPADMGFEPEGVALAFAGSGLRVEVVAIGRSEWTQGALGGGQQGNVDALLVPRDLLQHPDPAAWFGARERGKGWLAPFPGAVPADLAALAERAGRDAQAARALHGGLHDEAVWLFLFEERRPSAWGRRHHPWWTSPTGWGRIDAWGSTD